MKLYEATYQIVKDFGKKTLSDVKVLNLLLDYNAFEESKTFKIILKNIISEGYMDQLMNLSNDWQTSKDKITSNFILATSFNEQNATYVINAIIYGLGYTEIAPVYQPTSQGSSSASGNTGSTPSSPANLASRLNKTRDDIYEMTPQEFQKYKARAEKYLNGIVEYKTDIAKDLGIKVTPNITYLQNRFIRATFEIDGNIQADCFNIINLHLLVYNQSDKVIKKGDLTISEKSSFELFETMIVPELYDTVGNVKRFVLYHDIEKHQ